MYPQIPDNVFVSRAEHESIMPEYSSTSDDYLEMFIQFGYVSMFSCVFPLCGLLAFLNNLFEIRGDAWKLVTNFRRPFATPATGIGVWEHAFDIASYIAISVNTGLIGISEGFRNLFPGLNTFQYFVLVTLIEHVFFALRYGVSKIVPPIPHSLELKIAMLEHKRREALQTLEREERRCGRLTSPERSPDHSQPNSDIDV